MSEERPELDTIRDALRDHDARVGERPTGSGAAGAAARPDHPVRERLREQDEPDAPGSAGHGER